jgi:hypothetical protein
MWWDGLAKSTFGGIPALKSQVRIYSQSAPDLTLKMKTASADGKETTTQATYKLNGTSEEKTIISRGRTLKLSYATFSVLESPDLKLIVYTPISP